MRRAALGLLAAVLATAAAAGAARDRADARLTVLAASSLTNVFPQIDPAPRYSFSGSDKLAAQIEQGVPADVFAAASPKYPERMYAKGLVTKPVVFARNRLVVVVPASNPVHIRSVYDLTRRGIKLVIASAGVPLGSYTRQVLERLGLRSALANVVSEEVDARAVLAKVALGEADAGFVYVTDARTEPKKVATVPIPARAQPTQAYEIAIVAGSPNRAAAAAFVKKVLGAGGQSALRKAGFLPPR
jgi:molybdate transport system substrate-binding protein